MKGYFLLPASLTILFALAAASTNTTGQIQADGASGSVDRAAAQKPSKPIPVALNVTIEGFDSTGTPCSICGDNAEYVNGQAGIAASLDDSGNLILNFQTGRTAERLVSFNYGTPSGQGHQPVSGLYGGGYLSTLPISNTPYVAIQNMTIGSAQCIQLGWSYKLGDAKKTQWRHNFHRELLAFDLTPTAYAVVTRVNADTWEVEPKTAGCNAITLIARVFDTPTQGPFNFTDDGLYSLPFKLTLRRQ